jgi:protein-disulfide isomerase
MRSVVFLALCVAACRSTDGHSQSAPTRADSHATVAPVSDSARDAAMLERADAGRIQGDSTAMWFLIVSDFQCPFCKRWHDEVYPTILRDYVKTGRVRLAYVNLPLQQHAHAQEAAEAAMCAAAQNRFWQMHDALFAAQEAWASRLEATPVFDSLARVVALDTAQWRVCRRSAAIGRLVDGDRMHAVQSGVRSTPTFLIGNNVRVEGAQPIELFRSAIAEAFRKDSASRR